VKALAFDPTGIKLASGSKDTDIIIWDLVAEVGLVKLRGHKDQIVSLAWVYSKDDPDHTGNNLSSDSENALIISASKDATIKVWDVISQHCMETHIAQSNGECWAMSVTPDLSGCITAGNDGELKIWAIDPEVLAETCRGSNKSENSQLLRDRGILFRQSKERSNGIIWHPTADYFAVYGSQKAVEIWRVRSSDEVQKMLQRKRRRKREKLKAALENGNDDTDHAMTNTQDEEDSTETSITDYFVQHSIVRTNGKVSSVDWISGKATKNIQILVASSNNVLEVYDIQVKIGGKGMESVNAEYSRAHTIDGPGHRTDVRGLSLSSDDRMLATASSGLLKIWNVRTGACLRTLECGYALCCAFLPGDKIVLVGTKSGELELYDIASSTLIQSFNAHDGSIWTLQVHPDGRSCATGAADKLVKFWNFAVVEEDIPGMKRTISRLNLTHSRTLKLNDDILSLCFSPDSRLVAVSTLDNTVKVFFNDSLKIFLNLYGHKLPVISISISSDSKLIATSSADKNIRLWGLDFGDCHKALHGHNDSIMAVKFIPEPPSPQDIHFLFSVSKDKSIKSWDGDKFEQVQKLTGHHGEIWAMVMSKSGDLVVTASHDKSIRTWSLSDDLIFLEEEREKEIEELYEQTLTTSLDADNEDINGIEDTAVAPHKQSVTTLTGGEKIMEALELGMEDLKVVEEWEAQRASNPNMAPPRRDPLYLALGNISAERHVLNTLSKLPAAQLQDALLVLPFPTLPALFTFIAIWINKQWEVPLVCKVLFFMLKTHQKQIVASKELRKLLDDIRVDLRSLLGEIKDLMGFNVAALKSISDRAKEMGIATLEDAEKAETESTGKKRAFVELA
jgi:U3 small nucleolar RNA-associated protein 12